MDREEQVDSLKVDELEIVVEEGKSIIVRWLGASLLENPSSQIDPFFEELSKRLQGRGVIVDFLGLERMNSATVLAIINMCRTFDNKNIRTNVQYDESSEWQSVTFEGISTLSRVMKNISVEPKVQK